MDIRQKLKIAWKDTFNGDVPAKILSRLECENDIDVSSLLTGARHKTWETLSELELRLQQEKFILEFLDDEIKVCAQENTDKTADKTKIPAEIDNMYAKVNKPLKSKQSDPGETDDKHSNKSDQKIDKTDFGYEDINCQPCEPCKTAERRESYEEISFQPAPERLKVRPESLGKKEPKKKMKGSVRDKIKRFEQTSTVDGDENLPENSEGINKLSAENSNKVMPKVSTPVEIKVPVASKPTSPKPPPPVISPRPSPAIRKKQPQNNAYEDIELPCFGSTSEDKKAESSDTPGNRVMPVSTNPVTTNTCSDSQHDNSQNLDSSVKGSEVLNVSHNVSSVNLETTKITRVNEIADNDTENVPLNLNIENKEDGHYAVLKETAVKPTFSENEPAFSSSKSGDIKVSARGQFKHIEK